MTAEEQVESWVANECHAIIDVTAINPANGKTKKLTPEEVRELLKLLIEFEGVLRHFSRKGLGLQDLIDFQAKKSDLPTVERGEREKIEQFSKDFAALGLDLAWYDVGVNKKPLFSVKDKEKVKNGHSLKELIEAVREFGRARGGEALAEPKDKTVIVVDDDDALREMMEFMLRKEGFRVDIFPNGVEAMEHVHKDPERLPDLIVLDLMMPLQGGFEVLRELQTGEAGRIPIIVITGRITDHEMSDALHHEPNVKEFLSKPLRPDTFLKTVHKVLKTKPKTSKAA